MLCTMIYCKIMCGYAVYYTHVWCMYVCVCIHTHAHIYMHCFLISLKGKRPLPMVSVFFTIFCQIFIDFQWFSRIFNDLTDFHDFRGFPWILTDFHTSSLIFFIDSVFDFVSIHFYFSLRAFCRGRLFRPAQLFFKIQNIPFYKTKCSTFLFHKK